MVLVQESPRRLTVADVLNAFYVPVYDGARVRLT
jgi:hypothetical protein